MSKTIKSFSLGLLKPDCQSRRLIDKILHMIVDAGLEIVAIKTVRLNSTQIKAFYSQCIGEDYFEEMSSFLQSGYVTAYIVRAEDAISRLNSLVGKTDPKFARPGTIRALGIDIRHNLAHSSESHKEFLKEARIIFSDKELLSIGAI